jgi:hypothetical protein
MITYDQHDNEYTILKKILRVLHDRWVAGTMQFSAEPPVGAFSDLRMTLWKKMLQAVNLVAPSSGGQILMVERMPGLVSVGIDIPGQWQTPSIGAADFAGGIWTCPEAGDYLVSMRTSLESQGPGEAYSETLYIVGSFEPTIENAMESIISGGAGTIDQHATVYRTTLAAGQMIQLYYNASGANFAVLDGPLADDATPGSLASFWSIVKL